MAINDNANVCFPLNKKAILPFDSIRKRVTVVSLFQSPLPSFSFLLFLFFSFCKLSSVFVSISPYLKGMKARFRFSFLCIKLKSKSAMRRKCVGVYCVSRHCLFEVTSLFLLSTSSLPLPLCPSAPLPLCPLSPLPPPPSLLLSHFFLSFLPLPPPFLSPI